MNKNILKGLEPGVAEAMDGLISLFDMDTMRWLARLWDPTAGAFYYSNSGRDYEGFGPDLESTVQALRCVSQRGMMDDFDCSPDRALPESIKRKLVEFATSCADPDGYFYHPQWGKNIILSRKGRDLGWATQIFSWFKATPPYPTAIELLGNKSEADASLPAHLLSKKAFYEYLDTLDLPHRSYPAGNQLNAQSGQIRAAGLLDACLDYLDAHQLSTNGLWESEVNYVSVSGLMKVASLYASAGRMLPNYEKAVSSCLEAALSEERPGAVVYVYNPHSAVGSIHSAMQRLGDKAAVDYINSRYEGEIIPLIDRTREKLSIFRKADGSFSYIPEYSSHISQSAPVALYHENEGDVNATTIAISGGAGCLFSNLNIPFKIYDRADLDEFISIMLSRGPIVKKPVPADRLPPKK